MSALKILFDVFYKLNNMLHIFCCFDNSEAFFGKIVGMNYQWLK